MLGMLPQGLSHLHLGASDEASLLLRVSEQIQQGLQARLVPRLVIAQPSDETEQKSLIGQQFIARHFVHARSVGAAGEGCLWFEADWFVGERLRVITRACGEICCTAGGRFVPRVAVRRSRRLDVAEPDSGH